MSRSSFYVRAIVAALFSANAIQAAEPPIPGTGSSQWATIITEIPSDCIAGESIPPDSEPAGLHQSHTPNYLMLPQGMEGYLENEILPARTCDSDSGVCTTSAVLGYCLPEADSAELEFDLCGVPQNTQVFVGLLNSGDQQYDPVEIDCGDDLACLTSNLPIGSDTYRQQGWVEIKIILKWLVEDSAIFVCTDTGRVVTLGDVVSIRNVTLGPPS